jgi:hypothetical protein
LMDEGDILCNFLQGPVIMFQIALAILKVSQTLYVHTFRYRHTACTVLYIWPGNGQSERVVTCVVCVCGSRSPSMT